MLKEERHQHILEALKRDGKVVALELGEELNVSEDTIRRDLRELAETGLLQRVHGGALPRSSAITNYAQRQNLANSAKAAIAKAAVQLVHNGQVIILDSGTTTLQVAQHLPHNLHATVVTNSPPIAMALAEHPAVEVLIIGGQLDKESLAAVGAATVDAFHSIRADLCMLGVCSLHPDIGITVQHFEEAQVKRVMIANAAEVVALASIDKLGTATSYIVAPLSHITHLVTEASVPEEMLQPYQAIGITIVRG